MDTDTEAKRSCMRCGNNFLPSESNSETGRFCQACTDLIRTEEELERREKVTSLTGNYKRPIGFSLTQQTINELNEIRMIEHLKNVSAVIGFLTNKYYATWKPKEVKNDPKAKKKDRAVQDS